MVRVILQNLKNTFLNSLQFTRTFFCVINQEKRNRHLQSTFLAKCLLPTSLSVKVEVIAVDGSKRQLSPNEVLENVKL